jgi:penicillin-binding protein 1A
MTQRRRTPATGDADFDALVRRRARRQRGKARRKRRSGWILGFGISAILIAVVVASIGGAYAFSSSCSLSSLTPVGIGQNSFVYAADNSLLGSIPAEKNRQPVPAARVSPWLSRATVAIEDRRFYQHGGIDPQGIARALWQDIRQGRIVQGGSTITQQLVRNLYISRERTIQRKLKEACLAIKLSQHWSKARILNAYENQVYYGNHAYGIEAAAQTYFSRPARKLSLTQAALLAGLPQAPSDFDPFHAPQKALARRDEVLRAMRDNGDIGERQYEAAVAQRNLHLNPGRLYTRIREPYFFSYVRDQLIAEYGANTVRSGGLKVYTTIDPRFQNAAREAIRSTLNLPTDPAAALVAINPGNGAIRAMTAVTPGATGNQFNLVAQARRQPGSTFKTFVLAAAIEAGMNPSSTNYTSAPFHYQPDPYTPAWDVSTYDHTYAGTISVLDATLRSDNSVYAQLTLDVGPEKVAEMAHRLGVTAPLDDHGAYVPSIGLGSIPVSPLDEASAYATIAAGGIYSKPMAIRKVVLASGKVDVDAGWGRPQRKRVLSEGVAWQVTQVLQQNVLSGTGVGAYFGRPAAGKTGTTENHADAWFSGYVPQLQATVWVGYPKAEIPMENVHGIAVAGGTFPATIWHEFMQSAVGRLEPKSFPAPDRYPTFTYWRRGQYSLALAPATTSTTTEAQTGDTATTGTVTTDTTAPTVTTAPAVTTVPATTTTPPPTTTASPPAATTIAPVTPPPASVPATTSTAPPTDTSAFAPTP